MVKDGNFYVTFKKHDFNVLKNFEFKKKKIVS